MYAYMIVLSFLLCLTGPNLIHIYLEHRRKMWALQRIQDPSLSEEQRGALWATINPYGHPTHPTPAQDEPHLHVVCEQP